MNRATIVCLFGLAGCATKTVPVDHPYEVKVTHEVTVAVPPALSKDCQPAPLADTTIQGLVDRLAAVEVALSACRTQLGQIRELPVEGTYPPSAHP